MWLYLVAEERIPSKTPLIYLVHLHPMPPSAKAQTQEVISSIPTYLE